MNTAPPAPPAATKRLSHYQEKIIEFVARGRGHGVVQATAGAGKTSTLVEVAANLEPGVRACFLAFGRDAAAELEQRLPPSVTAMTVHKLGRRTLERALRHRQVRLQPVEKGKYRRLLRTAIDELRRALSLDEAQLAECEEYLASLLDLARLNLCDPQDHDALRDLVMRHTIVPPGSELEPMAHETLRLIFERGTNEALEAGRSDFTDMLYLPVTQRFEPPRFDFVCVDEAQDYSALALAFTRRLVDPAAGGRLLFVGDPRQSIYGFAGADSEALERISRETDAKVLPLSITYRCPRSHVALARLLAPEIEAGPNATEGRVFWVADAVLEHWAREGDMILCRANAPLVKTCLRLVRGGRRAYIRGRDLKRQLLELSERAVASDSTALLSRIEEFASREEKRLATAKGARRALLEALRDLIDCLRFLAANPGPGRDSDLQSLKESIERAFDEREDAVVLSTIHRAKGLEADRILLLYPELMPAPYARTGQSLRGEASVQFVALTRARQDLVFVSGMGSSDERLARERPDPPDGRRDRVRPGVPDRRPGRVRTGVPDDGLSAEDREGQGPGAWREVLELARVLARGRG